MINRLAELDDASSQREPIDGNLVEDMTPQKAEYLMEILDGGEISPYTEINAIIFDVLSSVKFHELQNTNACVYFEWEVRFRVLI